MGFLISSFKVIFLLSFLIFIHEGGHFLAAKLFKVRVENFSIGFGPKIFTKKGKETEYSLSLIPFGGYVKMTGESERSNEKGSFSNAKLLHRIGIVVAGPVVNIIFAIIVFFCISLFSGYNVSTTISEVLDIAVENLQGIEIGDKIVKINDKKIRLRSDISKALVNSNGESITLIVEREGIRKELIVKPTEYEGTYILGVQVALINGNLNQKIYYAFWETIEFLGSIVESFKLLFSGSVGINQMAGPIGISEIVVESKGIYNFIYLLSLISLSLGVTNLLPIPALDGGRVLLLVIEGIRGKALEEKIEMEIQSFSFLILILFSLYISYQDILRVFS